MIRVGVIGTGAIGSGHVHRLAGQLAGARVSAVFDVVAERAGELATQVGARAHTSAEALIAADDVEAVVIASPGERHADQVIACIAAGKPVLCEKPLATTTDDALRVVRAEAAAGRRLVQVGFMRRYDRAYRQAKAALDGGQIGQPLLAHAVHRNAEVPDFFVDEMALTDSVVHEIDAFRWLFGAEVAAVSVFAARQSPLAPGRLRDPQLVLLELTDGALVDVESFVNCQYGYDVRCEIVGSAGTVTIGHDSAVALTRSGQCSVAVPPDWQTRFAQAYLDELAAWVAGCVDDVRAGAAPVVGAVPIAGAAPVVGAVPIAGAAVSAPSAWDGYAAVAVAQAAVSSVRSGGGRCEVELIERPPLYLPDPASGQRDVEQPRRVPAPAGTGVANETETGDGDGNRDGNRSAE